MGVNISLNANEPIIIAVYTNPFNAVEDSNAVAGYLIDFLEKSKEQVYFVADMREINVTFSDLVSGLAVAYTTPGSPYANPRLKTFTVATDELISLGAKAVAEQRQYGRADVQLYNTVEAALTEIKTLMGK